MEPIAIAAATLAAKWAAESIVKEAAKSAFTSLKPVYDWIVVNLRGRPASEAVLDNLAMQPNETTTIEAVALIVNEAIQKDPALKSNLDALLERAKQDDATHSFVVQVFEGARVGKIVTIGTVNGNVTI
ncbi:hypothetical protein DEM27_24300 [Metarhizobium album]|uniref:Uncharacterized protein n=1 Tax=Metarhizobium album TaxID=2182425 RepID=A0A2U2DK26_9HYPH|nr:hypothetical protein [Rhizobium album]PWE53669.1 hypothetical protein DEM27_24300 [Rhizobium album]